MRMSDKVYHVLSWAMLLLLPLLGTACALDPKQLGSQQEAYVTVPLARASINEDQVLYEDMVANVTMLVFPTGRAERIAYRRVEVGRGEDVTRIPTTKMRRGVCDFYFFANTEESEVSRLTTRAEIEAFLYRQSLFVPSPELKGFPMSRVYRSQLVAAGTEQTPVVFAPHGDESKPFAPVSRLDIAGLKTQDVVGKVGLLRPCAKLSVELRGEGKKDITAVECYNVARDYSLAQLPDDASSALKAEATPLSPFLDAPDGQSKRAHIYVPEKLFASQPTWGDTSPNGITYVKLTTKGGRQLLVPIAHNAEAPIPKGKSYLDFVAGKILGKGNERPNYGIVRNMHYMLNVDVSPDASAVDVSLKVMPWTLVESEFSHGRPKYSIEVKTESQPSIASSSIGTELEIHDEQQATITFRISEPKGALWTASVSNSLDFKLEGDTKGMVGKTEQSYTMTVRPRAKFNRVPQYTQFYIMVNGREIYLGDLSSAGSTDGVGRFTDEVAEAKRWVFKSVE